MGIWSRVFSPVGKFACPGGGWVVGLGGGESKTACPPPGGWVVRAGGGQGQVHYLAHD